MKKITRYLLVLCMLPVLQANTQQFYNVLQYGAKNDSSRLCTKAIAQAIAAASKAGGGTVYFPSGKYLTGAIHLTSNITIFIDAGAELHFSDNFDDYLPMVQTRYEGVDVTSFSPLFYAYGAENIAIKGSGLIDGHGKKWWDLVEGFKKDQPRTRWQHLFDSLNTNILLPDDPAQMKRGFLRPPFIQPMYCRNVLVEGIHIRNSPFWTINPEFCENVTVHAVTINNPHSPNTDGINPESCRYVHISDCHISVGDDCITIKSGKDIPGRAKNVAAEDYTITNCTMLSGHGGVVIGSEMSGGVKKIAISNCIFDGTDRGIRIKTARGRGGVVEDIRVSNIIMKNIREAAFVMDMQYAKSQPGPVSERTPVFRNIRFSNITAQTKDAGIINGIEEMPVEGISFQDIQIDAENGFVIKEAKDISFTSVSIRTNNGPAIKAVNTNGIDLNGCKVSVADEKIPLVQLTDVTQAFIRNCTARPGTTFLKLQGAKTKNILMKYNLFSPSVIPYTTNAEVTEKIIVE